MPLHQETRALFNQYQSGVAQINKVSDVNHSFTVAPVPAQQIIQIQQESSEFLRSINVRQVDNQQGQTVGMSATSRVASRTPTRGPNKEPRQTKDPTGLSKMDYFCAQTNSDIGLHYDTINAWRHDPEFATIWGRVVAEAQALDRICIGFNGQTVAEKTNITNHPLLEDVNVGWLKNLETEKLDHFLKHAPAGANAPIQIGDAIDGSHGFKTLDALVWAMLMALPAHRRKTPGMVAIVADNLATEQYFPIINRSLDPTEWLARDVIMSSQKVGTLPAMAVPFVPDGTVIITPLKNLSIYEQTGSRLRRIEERSEWDEISDWNSVNEAYPIEDLDIIFAAQNIEFAEPAPI